MRQDNYLYMSLENAFKFKRHIFACLDRTKCYSGSVSNSAIQQVVAGLKFYDCAVGMVITNSYFTKRAMELAKANNINLWDRDKLENELNAIIL